MEIEETIEELRKEVEDVNSQLEEFDDDESREYRKFKNSECSRLNEEHKDVKYVFKKEIRKEGIFIYLKGPVIIMATYHLKITDRFYIEPELYEVLAVEVFGQIFKESDDA